MSMPYNRAYVLRSLSTGAVLLITAVAESIFRNSRCYLSVSSTRKGAYSAPRAGELTAVSEAPAIATAVLRATGKRVRDLRITLDALL
jgi:hypothetical protein